MQILINSLAEKIIHIAIVMESRRTELLIASKLKSLRLRIFLQIFLYAEKLRLYAHFSMKFDFCCGLTLVI